MRLLPKNVIGIPDKAMELLDERAEMFVRSGLTLPDFESLTDVEILKIIKCRDIVEMERLAAVAVMLSGQGAKIKECIDNDLDPAMQIGLEKAVEEALV